MVMPAFWIELEFTLVFLFLKDLMPYHFHWTNSIYCSLLVKLELQCFLLVVEQLLRIILVWFFVYYYCLPLNFRRKLPMVELWLWLLFLCFLEWLLEWIRHFYWMEYMGCFGHLSHQKYCIEIMVYMELVRSMKRILSCFS